ncbi:sulfate transporter [Candidatus Saccharibacteria bacterium]|nr:MAG: sulfate transporter [Candidatus Saccharibacteria bacterium]
MKFFQFTTHQGWSRTQLRADFIAALVVTAIAIPESLGFAAIVGLPVQTGLYCALLAPVVFALMTSSKHLVVGADSATAALVASGASAAAVFGSAQYPGAVATLTLLTGIILVVMALLRFGFLADLISKPVFIGLLAGVGVQLMVGRLPEMLGLDLSGTTLEKLGGLASNIGDVSILTLWFSLSIFAIILIANKRKLPGSLIAIVAAMLVTFVLHLEEQGIAVIQAIPSGLPLPFIPDISVATVMKLLPAAIAIAIVILAQSSTVTRNTAARFDEPIDDNRDLGALGLANIASSVTHGFAINGSPPRTIAAELSGGRTQMVNIFMAGIIAVILLFFAHTLAYLPVAALATVIFSVGLHLFDAGRLRHIWKARREEFFIAVVALLGVALFGVQYGVAIAVVVSILDRLRRQHHPVDDILLRDQKLDDWAKDRLNPHHKNRSSPPGVLVYRFGGSVFFENADYFAQRLRAAIAEAKNPVSYVIVDAGAINDLDYTAAETLKHICMKCHADGMRFALAHVPPELEDLLARHSLVDIIGKHNIFPSLEEAVFDAPTSRRSSIDMVQRLRPPEHQYIVIGGSVMEMLKLRKTGNLDLVVSRSLYKHYRSKKWKEYIQDDGKRILSHNGNIIMQTYVGKSLKDLLPRAQYIEGVPFMHINDLIACKKTIGRKKDLEDVRRLEKYLREHPHARAEPKRV